MLRGTWRLMLKDKQENEEEEREVCMLHQVDPRRQHSFSSYLPNPSSMPAFIACFSSRHDWEAASHWKRCMTWA